MRPPALRLRRRWSTRIGKRLPTANLFRSCLLYTSDAADERSSVDLGGRRIIKKKTNYQNTEPDGQLELIITIKQTTTDYK